MIPFEQVRDLKESPRMHELSKWESDFVDSIEEQIEQERFLSDKQKQKLQDIYDKLFG